MISKNNFINEKQIMIHDDKCFGFNLLLLGNNKSLILSLVRNFLFGSHDYAQYTNNTDIFHIINKMPVNIENHYFSLNIKFMINIAPEPVQNFNMYDYIIFVFDILDNQSLNYIKETAINISSNNIVHFVGVNNKLNPIDTIHNKSYSMYNSLICGNDFINYYNEISVLLNSHVNSFFSCVINNYISHLISKTKINNTQLSIPIISYIIKSQIMKRDLSNQVNELNKFITDNDIKNRSLIKQLNENISELNIIIDDLNIQINEKNDVINDLNFQINDKNDIINSLQHQINDVGTKKNNLLSSYLNSDYF